MLYKKIYLKYQFIKKTGKTKLKNKQRSNMLFVNVYIAVN